MSIPLQVLFSAATTVAMGWNKKKIWGRVADIFVSLRSRSSAEQGPNGLSEGWLATFVCKVTAEFVCVDPAWGNAF